MRTIRPLLLFLRNTISITLLTVLAFGAVGELFCRVMSGSQATRQMQRSDYAYHDGYYTRIPGRTASFTNEGGVNIALHIDGNGLRNPEGAFEASDIWILGDSFVLAVNTPDRETLVDRLRQKGLGVYNAGMDGFGTFEAFNLLRSLMAKKKPRLVVLMFYMGNDFKDNVTAGSSLPHTKNIFDKAFVKAYNFLNQHLVWSAFARYLTGKMVGQYAKLLYGNMASYCVSELSLYGVPSGDELAKIRQPTASALHSMKNFLDQEGVTFFVAAIPSKAQVDRSVLEVSGCHQDQQFQGFILKLLRDRNIDFDAPLKMLQDICQEEGIALIELTKNFRSAYPHKLYYQFDAHWNASAQQLTSDILARFIVTQFLIP